MSHSTALPTELKTIRDVFRWGVTQFHDAELFFGHGVATAYDEMRWLLADTLHLPHELPETLMDAALVDTEKAQLAALIHTRVTTRKPLAYLLGKAWFHQLPFIINEHTLVPRSPIAEMIGQQFAPWIEPQRVLKVLDLCTGSGCIGIACAYEFPEAEVILADISDEALSVAQQNIHMHGVEDRVAAIKSDLYQAVAEHGPFDIIVTNPPYVSEEELDYSPDEFHQEPRLGLVAGDYGLDCAIPIIDQASDLLIDGGILVCEVGNSSLALEAYYPNLPFNWVDFANGGDGVFVLTKEELPSNIAG